MNVTDSEMRAVRMSTAPKYDGPKLAEVRLNVIRKKVLELLHKQKENNDVKSN